MPRISRTDDNVVAIPSNVSVGRGGYVYLNTSTWWGETRGGSKCGQHAKVCVGIAVAGKERWRGDRRMWANANWWAMFPKGPTEVAPAMSDCVRVGLTVSLSLLADGCGVAGCLDEALGDPSAADMVIDIACYVICEESAVAQHYAHWARDHATRSGRVWSDSSVSRLLSRGITAPQVEEFKRLWAKIALGDGRVFLCYDSTNVNSQAEGVFLVQKGHAKDDPDLEQVNTDYVVRQSDGLPVTFTEYPGSVNDVMQAREVYAFFARLVGDGLLADICMIFDRGYVSEENVRDLHSSGVGFLMLLKRSMGVTEEVISLALGELRTSGSYLADEDAFAVTLRHGLFEGIDAWFHVVLDPGLEDSHRVELFARLAREEARLERDAARGTHHTDEELGRLRAHFRIEAHEDGTLEVNMRGRGAGKKKEVPAYVIDSFERDAEKIDAELLRCGVYVIATDREASATAAMRAYAKREQVEKTFRALKSYMGMDKYGVHSDAAMHAKALVWFVASVLRTLLFTKTEALRGRDRKRHATPATIRLLDEIEAIRDLDTGEYRRRYLPTKAQKDVLRALGVKEAQLDEAVGALSSE